MKLNYDIKKLEAVLTDFHNTTGIKIDLLDDSFRSVVYLKTLHNSYCHNIQCTETGRCRCQNSDREILTLCKQTHIMQMHVCHAGLVDIAVPLLNDGQIIGYLILGQMKKDEDFSDVYKKIADLNLNFEEMNKYYKNLTHFDKTKIESMANLAIMLSKYILLENMINPFTCDVLKKATDFIHGNLENPLNVHIISHASGYSVSALYKNFHKHFGCTVNEYIAKKRIEKSITMLRETDFSVETISEKCGFSSVQYYSKIFKEKTGTSPLKFRKTGNYKI